MKFFSLVLMVASFTLGSYAHAGSAKTPKETHKSRKTASTKASFKCICQENGSKPICGSFELMTIENLKTRKFDATIGDSDGENSEGFQYVLSKNQERAEEGMTFFDATKDEMNMFGGKSPRLLVSQNLFKGIAGNVKVISRDRDRRTRFFECELD